MGLVRSSFARGWMPDADAVQAPADALLRMDNGVLDELGTVALRKGSAVRSTLSGSIDALYTSILNGTRYRLAQGGNEVYVNGSGLQAMTGSGDVAFGSHLGQILFARGTTKKKYDGATLRNWGIAMTGGKPSVGTVTADSKVIASCDSGEGGWTFVEDDGATTYTTGFDGTANGAIETHPKPSTNRSSIKRDLGGPTDFTTYDGGTAASDDDLFEFWIRLGEPKNVTLVQLNIDVGDGSFGAGYFTMQFIAGSQQDLVTLAAQGGDNSLIAALPTSPNTWTRIQIRRGDINQTGISAGNGWNTVRAVALTTLCTQSTEIDIDRIRLVSSANLGTLQWRYIYVNDTGTYIGKSGPSDPSDPTAVSSYATDVTIPADASRDSQVTAAWVFRLGGTLADWTRTATVAIAGVSSYTVRDTLSDADALTVDILLEDDNTTPPDNIIDIEGPYYDRTIVLTADSLYPSRRLNPDSFSTSQVVTIGGADEQALWVKKSFGGLFVGTTKDIYRLDGDGAELPDGSVNFTLRNVNIDHPPIGASVAQDGNLLVYLSAVGWRALNGSSSQALAGATSLLYRGYTRHGVSPINYAGRCRSAIAHGQLVAIVPEQDGTIAVYRQAPGVGALTWYRHLYPCTPRSLFHEADGTLLLGDSAGHVWELDTGADDNGAGIPVTLWTKVDDDGQPFNRKDGIDLRVLLDTAGATATVSIHLDASASSSVSSGMHPASFGSGVASLESIPAFTQVQLRLTGTFTTFRLASFSVAYQPLPQPFRGALAPTHFGDPRVKTFSGFQFRACTAGGTCVLTPYIDGVAQLAATITTDADDPADITLQFPSPVTGVEVYLHADTDIELYDWKPLISTRRPLGVKSYDTGPIMVGERELIWIRQARFKVNAGADLNVTLYLDGRAYPMATASVIPGVDTIVPLDLGRSCVARVARLVVVSTAPFYPYYFEVTRRTSGLGTGKPTQRFALSVDQTGVGI